jgi:hypothetical protein
MEFIYTINIYEKGKKFHSEQLISLGNYKSLNRLLVGEDDIKSGEYIVDNGKMLIAVIDNILREKYLREEPQTITVKNSRGGDVVKLHHPFTNLTASFINFVIEEQEKSKLSGEDGILIFSQAIKDLFNTHDLFTNLILINLFSTLDCIDKTTGDVKEGFKLTVTVEEEQDE